PPPPPPAARAPPEPMNKQPDHALRARDRGPDNRLVLLACRGGGANLLHFHRHLFKFALPFLF
ncbi:hypothetical protein CWB78_15295, partial [Pseudoalteromonas sp. S1612]